MTMEQLSSAFVRGWMRCGFTRRYRQRHAKTASGAAMARGRDLEKFAMNYENQSIAKKSIYMEKTGNFLSQ